MLLKSMNFVRFKVFEGSSNTYLLGFRISLSFSIKARVRGDFCIDISKFLASLAQWQSVRLVISGSAVQIQLGISQKFNLKKTTVEDFNFRLN